MSIVPFNPERIQQYVSSVTHQQQIIVNPSNNNNDQQYWRNRQEPANAHAAPAPNQPHAFPEAPLYQGDAQQQPPRPPSPLYATAPLATTRKELDINRRTQWKKRKRRDFQFEDILCSDKEDNSDDDIDEEEQRNRIERFKRNRSLADIEQEREEYWRNEDLTSEWCLMCRYNRQTDSDQQQSFPFLQRIQEYIEGTVGKVNDKELCNTVQDIFIAKIRQHLPIRAIDPYTNKPKPPHWWHLPIINDHIYFHDNNIRIQQELTYRALIIAQHDLQNIIREIRIDNPEDKRYRDRELKQWMEVVKLKRDHERQLEISRGLGSQGSMGATRTNAKPH